MAAPALLAADQAGAAPAQRPPLQLSLRRAIELATAPEGAARIQLSGEALRQAESRSAQARAALLPDLSASTSEQNRTVNLAALGVRINVPVPGFSFPTLVGPFNTLDARVNASQSVFDFSAIRRLQASRAGIAAAKSDVAGAGEQVAGQVARAYLAAVRGVADVETARANIALSEAVLEQAQHQKQAGTGTGIEITRAQVQLANDRQRLLVAQNAERSARLQLLRAIGLPLDTALELTDRLGYIPVDAVTLEQAKAEALKQRPDLEAQRQREANARLAAGAVRLERLPTVGAFGDYGAIGTGFDNALATRSYGISVRIPIFDGGRRDARRAEANSQYRAETIRTADLRQQIELDVRLALDSLGSADEQVKVAREGLGLAENELAQARRRYDAGVAGSLEVTDAQTRLERARDNQTMALYNYNVARIDLEQALGSARRAAQ
jgi:outer membrane protein TolC